jgi:hypothetical protein
VEWVKTHSVREALRRNERNRSAISNQPPSSCIVSVVVVAPRFMRHKAEKARPRAGEPPSQSNGTLGPSINAMTSLHASHNARLSFSGGTRTFSLIHHT